MSENETTIPTWGYSATEKAQIFNLPSGKDLPKGWYDTPAHPKIIKEREDAEAMAALEAEDAARQADEAAQAQTKELEDLRAEVAALKAKEPKKSDAA